jgi:hypothetical protein
MNRKSFAMAIALTLAGAAEATQKTTVPAFFALNQTTDGVTADWTRIKNQGSAVLAVVALGDSGGFELCGPGQCDLSAAQTQFAANHTAGQLVLGYVKAGLACTASGNRSTAIQNVKTGTYGVATWYSKYPTQIQGIFYDLGPQLYTCAYGDLYGSSPEPESNQQSDYHSIYSYVGTNHSGAQVMLNASQFQNSWIMSGTSKSADYALIFERDYSTWYSNYKAADGSSPGWWTSGYSGQLANVVTNADQYDMQNGVSQSATATYGSPVIYFYDGSSTAYDHLACGFETQVALLQNQSSIPDPSTYCSGACSDLDSDSNNCGACGNACTGSGQQCNAGACMVDCGNDCWMYTQADCYTNCN